MPAPLLQLIEVTKRYAAAGAADSVNVLDGITLEVGSGESLAMWMSGSGKSTLLQIIGALDRPSSGQVLLAGKNLAVLDDRELARCATGRLALSSRRIIYCRNVRCWRMCWCPLAGAQSVACHPQGELPSARAQRLLKRVGLGGRLHHRPGQLSGGERQRVAVVRALINQPQLVLADEPTGALDHAAATALGQLFVELNQEEGVTLIVVTHAVTLAQRMGRVMRLEDGRLSAAAP